MQYTLLFFISPDDSCSYVLSNGDIIISIGLLSYVLTFIKARIDSPKDVQVQKLTECFHFLHAISAKYPDVQKR